MTKYLKNPVKLNFDPLDKNNKELTNIIFQDEVAKIFWMGIKQVHLTNQYFNQYCLDASKIIQQQGVPNSPEKLKEFILRQFDIPCSQGFVEDFFPYVSGQKNLEYEIVNK